MARPKFEATEERRRMVKTMAGVGARHEEIVQVLKITPKTLRRHLRQELDDGVVQANVQVMNTLFKMATSGRYAGATIFWAKTRCRWQESNRREQEEKLPPQFQIHIEGEKAA